ncbi:hypothetical protein O9X98_10565 [Agrobacterium salinitolerans]|nr:hypothetical protein [Agrobacterium salinitolerans]
MIGGLVSSAVYLYPAARFAYQYALAPDDPVTAAELRLSALDGTDYEREAKDALVANDAELAKSFAVIAGERGHPLPSELAAEIEKASEFSFTQTASETWSGLVSGNTDTPAAFAGSLAADLSVAGDVRDLYGEVVKYPDYDELTVALSAVGIVATGATVVSAMNALPAKAGVSLLKSAKKAGKLPEPLQRELSGMVAKSVDMDAAREAMHSAGKLDTRAALTAAGRVVKPDVLAKLGDAATSFGTVSVKQGYRGAVQSLKLAESTDDIRRLEKVSTRYGDGYRAVVKATAKAGRITLRLGEFALLMAWRLIGMAVWAVGTVIVVADMATTVGRFAGRVRRTASDEA